MTLNHATRDASLEISRALPNGNAVVASDGIDLQNGARGDFLGQHDLVVEAPALTVTELPNSETFTYDVYHDTAAGFGSEALLMSAVLVQTGAGGAGAAAATKHLRLPRDVKRYVRLKISGSASAGNATGKSATFALRF